MKHILVRKPNSQGRQGKSPMGFMEMLIVELNGGGVGSDLEVELIGSAQRHYSIACHEIKLILKRKFRSLYRSIARAAERKSPATTAFIASSIIQRTKRNKHQRPLFITAKNRLAWWHGSRCRLTHSLQPGLILHFER